MLGLTGHSGPARDDPTRRREDTTMKAAPNPGGQAAKTASPLYAQTRTIQRCGCGKQAVSGGQCEECRRKGLPPVQRAATARDPLRGAAPLVDGVLRSSGQPLDRAARAELEPRFSADFSRVRVHSDARAAESARALDAHAYTVGHDVVFDHGRYRPSTSEGRSLLAHELAHVAQQARGSVSGRSGPDGLIVSEPGDPFRPPGRGGRTAGRCRRIRRRRRSRPPRGRGSAARRPPPSSAP